METENQLIPYEITDATLKEYRELYKDVPDAETKEGMAVIVSGLSHLRGAAASLNKAVTTKTKEINAEKKKMQDEAKRIVGELGQIIEPYAAAKKAVDDRKAKEKAEKLAAEKERIKALMLKIGKLRKMKTVPFGATSEVIADLQLDLEDMTLTEEVYEEYLEQAKTVHADSMEAITNELKRAIERERVAKEQAEEKEKLKAEREKLEAEREAMAKEREEHKKTMQALEDAKPKPPTVTIVDTKEEAQAVSKETQESALDTSGPFPVEKWVKGEKSAIQTELEQAIDQKEKVGGPRFIPADPQPLGMGKEPVKDPEVIPTPMEEVATAIMEFTHEHDVAVFIAEAIKGGNIPHVTYNPEQG